MNVVGWEAWCAGSAPVVSAAPSDLCGRADQQPCSCADPRQVMDALFLAEIRRDHQQAWQTAEFRGSFARAGIVGVGPQLHGQCPVLCLWSHSTGEAQTPRVRQICQGGIRSENRASFRDRGKAVHTCPRFSPDNQISMRRSSPSLFISEPGTVKREKDTWQ